MKIPNFDNIDLAIFGLVILGLAGFGTGIILKASVVELFSFETALALGIAGLATGKPKENKPVSPVAG